MATYVIRSSFFCGGIRISEKNTLPAEGGVIYASNHPSELDGFLLALYLGPKVIPMTAPLQQFPYPIALWLSGMEAIDVLRDDIDKSLYKKGHTKKEALHKTIMFLKDGYSILLFPEGHTELIEALYRFHTGAARISFAAGAPIQTVIIKDAHKVFSNTFKQNQGVVTVEFGKKFAPEAVYGEEILFTEDEHLREKVRERTQSLEHEILRRLPLMEKEEQRLYDSKVGVFVDIDLTIYRSLSQVDFLMNLTRKGLIPYSETLKVIMLFLGEKLHFVSHDTLVKYAVRLISGWKIETIDRLMRKFFRDLAIPKIEYGLFAILEDHLAKGHHVVFVSEVMHPVAKAFVSFFEADKAIDTSLRKRGLTYTGEISLLCRGDEKRIEVEKFIDEQGLDASKSYAYGDSFSDIPFLSLVGHPMAVNPDRKLKRYAMKHGFFILKKHA